MAGYADASQFQQSMKSTSVLVPCMKKHFGTSYCPHCEEAIGYYDRARSTGDKELEKKGSSKYWKRMYYGIGLVSMPGAPQNGQVCITHYPANVFKSIMDGINHQMPELRWPNPDSLPEGRPLILQKFKKDAIYNDYKIEMHPQPQVLTQEWFDSVRGSLPNMRDDLEFLNAYYNWPAQNKLIPVSDMQVGSVAVIRVLPLKTMENLMPFKLMHFHYVDTLGRWDTLWRDARWDVSREAEIMQTCGYGQYANAQSGAGAYPASAPGPSGVAAPGLGALTGGSMSSPSSPGFGEVPF